MPALGEDFRSAREARGLSLSDVAEQIHIRSVYLGAIEQEDWPQIGAPVYVRGFIRTYARFLGLDAEAAVQRFNETVPADRPLGSGAALASMDDDHRSGPSLWTVVGILVAIVVVAFVGYEWWQYNQGSSVAPIAQASAPTSAGPATAVPSADAAAGSPAPGVSGSPAASPSASPSGSPSPRPAHQLALRFTQKSWLRVVVDGKVQIEGLVPAGVTKTYSGHVAYVRAGNAGGVSVSLDGAPAKALGKPGDVVEMRYTL
jgi:cytoskeletal protein RodZ